VDDPTVPNAGNIRHIRTEDPADMTTFQRQDYYLSFPNVIIATNDTLNIPSVMGIDAVSIRHSNLKTGKMVLRSDTTDKKVYDASLRISGASGNSDVEAGSVVIERDLSLYRGSSPTGNTNDPQYPLFAFASPMTAMRSGYFAGNWIRRLLEGADGHVEYVYGNQGSGQYIDFEQYVYDPLEPFVPGKGYLVKARPHGYDYQDFRDEGGLSITNANINLYDQSKFVFNGQIYTLSYSPEQVFAANTLFTRTVNSNPIKTRNWIIGNSWTSAISVDKLVTLISNSALWFEPSIYVYPAGSTTYQRYIDPTWNSGSDISLIPSLESIPSQSLFMIRLLATGQAGAGNQSGTFTLDKNTVAVHSQTAHNTMLRSSSPPSYTNEVLFRVTPEKNPNIYDLAAVGLRTNARTDYDAKDTEKIYLPGNSAFMLYTLSTDNRKLSINALPPETQSTRLCFYPGESGGEMTITASRTESLEQIWLEDVLTHSFVDLKQENTYSFTSSPQDTPERFIVHFVTMPTGTETVSDNFLQGYYSHGELVIKGLMETDLKSTLRIFDTQGRSLSAHPVTQTPEMHLPLSLREGVYIAKLQGTRSITIKFRKGTEQ
jgi:hypothetical protein